MRNPLQALAFVGAALLLLGLPAVSQAQIYSRPTAPPYPSAPPTIAYSPSGPVVAYYSPLPPVVPPRYSFYDAPGSPVGYQGTASFYCQPGAPVYVPAYYAPGPPVYPGYYSGYYTPGYFRY
jgi:hypothetical protein